MIEELEAWFDKDNGRGMLSRRYPDSHWEVTVFDLIDEGHLEGYGEGETLYEALEVAIADYQRIYCGAI